VLAAIERELTAEEKLVEKEIAEATKVLKGMQREYPKPAVALTNGGFK
jgi:hypothetical protein